MSNYKYSVNEIIEVIDEVTPQLFGEDFKFRYMQKTAIAKICFGYLNELTYNVILDAPTGTGKSIIAMVSAAVLNNFKDKSEHKLSSFLITSNVELQNQYKNDITKHRLNWGVVKGMRNYNCNVTGSNFSLAPCQVKRIGGKNLKALPCYKTCSYFNDKAKAIASDISVLNYSLFLTYHALNLENNPFDKRNLTFFDEAHTINNIVQNHFSLQMTPGFFKKSTRYNIILC